jgi:hypothetical protein
MDDLDTCASVIVSYCAPPRTGVADFGGLLKRPGLSLQLDL